MIYPASKDPFNRFCYPWGSENRSLIAFYQKLGHIRKTCECLREGSFFTLSEMLSCLAFERVGEKDALHVIVNRNNHPISYNLPGNWQYTNNLLNDADVTNCVYVDAFDAVILKKEK